MEGVVHATQSGRRALGVHDAAAGGHPVDVARLDFLHRAQAVAMHHCPLPQVGDGSQSNVRMRAHGHRLFPGQHGRPDVVEEDKGPDAATIGTGQHAADGEAAQVVNSRTVELWHGSHLA